MRSVIGSRLGRPRKRSGPGLTTVATGLGVLLLGYAYYEHRFGDGAAALLPLDPDPDEVTRRPLPDGGLDFEAGIVSLPAGPARTIEGALD